MAVSLRPARPDDFDFCLRLYAEDLALYIADPAERTAKAASLRPRWHMHEVRIIVQGGLDVGWLQGAPEGDSFFIIQFFIEGAMRGQGIGRAVLERVIEEAKTEGRDVTLEVVKG